MERQSISVSEPMTSRRQGPPLLLQRAQLSNPLSAPSFFQNKIMFLFFGRSFNVDKIYGGRGSYFLKVITSGSIAIDPLVMSAIIVITN